MTTGKILVETAPGQTRLAFLDKLGDIQDIWHCRHDLPNLIGSVHHARIEQVFASQNRARARLVDNTIISLRLRKSYTACIRNGAVVPITIISAPRHGKAWQAVLGARLGSVSLVLLPGQSGAHLSKNLDMVTKEKLSVLCDDLPLPSGFAVILRQAAGNLSVGALHKALTDLVVFWRSGFIERDKNKLGVLHSGGDIRDQAQRSVLASSFWNCKPGSSESNMIDATIVTAMQPKIVLLCGGVIWFQRTNALWAIDIDSADADINRLGFGPLLHEAADKIARQMRIRGMAGPVMVDMPIAGAIARQFRENFQSHLDIDPQSPKMLGLTRGGLLELWRPHGRMALLDVMADHVAQAALAGLRLAAARPAFKPVQLAVNSLMAHWLNNSGKAAVDKLSQPLELVQCLNDEIEAPAYVIDSGNSEH